MKTTLGILLMFLFTGASPVRPYIPPQSESYAFEEAVLRYNSGKNELSKKDLKVDSLAVVAREEINAR